MPDQNNLYVTSNFVPFSTDGCKAIAYKLCLRSLHVLMYNTIFRQAMHFILMSKVKSL